jgi:ribosome maturation factor RimP
MYFEELTLEVRREVEPILEGLGFRLVELSIGRLKGSTRVNIVVYRPEGVGVNECAEISRLLFPRLENIQGLVGVSLEVSSPGTERRIKTRAEYEIFKGRGVRVLAGDSSEWVGGVIERVNGEALILRVEGRAVELPLASIRRARLDYTVEPRENDALPGRHRTG